MFFAYFFWLYKEVAPPADGRLAAFMRGRGSDVLAAILLGMATFSKPLNVLLVGPFVLLLWWRRRFVAGLVVGVVFVATVGSLFSTNAAISGEFNYQGSDTGGANRKIFYTWFPFASPDATFENARGGYSMVTSDADTENVFDRGVFWPRLARNVYYFSFGPARRLRAVLLPWRRCPGHVAVEAPGRSRPGRCSRSSASPHPRSPCS